MKNNALKNILLIFYHDNTIKFNSDNENNKKTNLLNLLFVINYFVTI